jgi:2-polyprenyl-3-methyl-5-hydroxy-6-metoxy-1,4-benzoquinol methylase
MKRERIAALAKYVVAKLLKRDLLFLPEGSSAIVFDGSQGKTLLPVRYTYRASPKGLVSYHIQLDGYDLLYSLHTSAFSMHQPVQGDVCFSFSLPSVKKGDTLQVALTEPRAWINSREIDVVSSNQQKARKFIAKLALSNGSGRLTRVCSHYLGFEGKAIGKDYYFGDDYVDYPKETDVEYALDLVRKHRSKGRLLDVGCALGIYTKAFLERGFDAYGIDTSDFAATEAAKRVGDGRIRQSNIDLSDIPFDGTFDIFWVWDVLEHSTDPQRMLIKLTESASSGSLLFLNTTNVDSLQHRLLGGDWEGYSDYSHYGAEVISVNSLVAWLKDLDWEIIDLKCYDVWVAGADPVISRLSDAFRRIPELSILLSERDLGDVIFAVARKR